MTKCIIFDLDGTLANTIYDIRDGLNGMLTEYGFNQISVEQTLSNINNGALELVRRSLPKDKRNDEQYVKDAKLVYESYYSKCYNNKTKEYDGITPALLLLAEQKIKLAVLSNKQDEFVKKIVNKLFPSVPFSFIMGQSEYFPTKPSPDSILHIISKLEISPDEAVLVGDSNVDMLTASNAGITSVGVSWGYRPADILISCGAKHILTHPSEISNLPIILNQ